MEFRIMSLIRRHPRAACGAAVTAALGLAIGFFAVTNAATAKEPLGRSWPAGQQISMDEIDHAGFDSLLKKHVDKDGFVNYPAWHKSKEDRQALSKYLVHLSQASPTSKASREGQLAFWINAYNAVTLEGILQVYPTDSIRKHTAKLGGYNIWQQLPLLVDGKPYSLEDIEHKVLRKMGEPRIHFAIVCASVGCPRLLNEAYVGEKLDAQLATNATDFFSRPQNFQVDRSGAIKASSILDWFGTDFGATPAEQFGYLKPYLPKAAQAVATQPNVRVSFLDYDWSLNDQTKKIAASGTRK